MPPRENIGDIVFGILDEALRRLNNSVCDIDDPGGKSALKDASLKIAEAALREIPGWSDEHMSKLKARIEEARTPC